MAKPLNVPDRWRAPIGAAAYIGLATVVSLVICLVTVWLFAIRPLDHQASLRQKDTNTIATALCVSRTRSLQTYLDPKTSMKTRVDSLAAADAYETIIAGLSPHPPTSCLGIDPNP